MSTVKPEKPIQVGPEALPFCCPPADVPAWNLHPRVYLPIKETGQEQCPYCGACYVLDQNA